MERGQWVNTLKPVRSNQNPVKRLSSTDPTKNMLSPRHRIHNLINENGQVIENKNFSLGSSTQVNLQLGQRPLGTKHKEDVKKQNEMLKNIMMPPIHQSLHNMQELDLGSHEYSESFKNQQWEREKRARQAKDELEIFFACDFLNEEEEVNQAATTMQTFEKPKTRNFAVKQSKTKGQITPSPSIKNFIRTNSCNQQINTKFEANSMADFKISRTLGNGAFATVKLATHEPTNKKVALKIYHNLQGIQLKAVQQEIFCMKKLQSDFFPRLYCDFETLEERVLVQEYIQGKSLLKMVQIKGQKGIKESEAIHLLRGLAKALTFMHGNNICHRDLKMDNIIIADQSGRPKIIDFGFSIECAAEQKLKITCGTTLYMAPELLNQQSYSGFAVDVWALGVIFYIILSGQAPFKHKSESELKSRIIQGSFIFPTTVGYEAQRLITKMMSLDPRRRPTAQEICHDQWLKVQDFNFPQVVNGNLRK